MNTIHPDHASHQVKVRQEIIREGISAARNPGDVAAIRETIGQLLIRTGERIRGHQARAARHVDAPARRVAQMAR